MNCLMYADDLLILCEAESGLTESLVRLSNYAETWKLKISGKKIKIIVFNKAGKTMTRFSCERGNFKMSYLSK